MKPLNRKRMQEGTFMLYMNGCGTRYSVAYKIRKALNHNERNRVKVMPKEKGARNKKRRAQEENARARSLVALKLLPYDTQNYFMLYIVETERMCFTITRRYMHD